TAPRPVPAPSAADTGTCGTGRSPDVLPPGPDRLDLPLVLPGGSFRLPKILGKRPGRPAHPAEPVPIRHRNHAAPLVGVGGAQRRVGLVGVLGRGPQQPRGSGHGGGYRHGSPRGSSGTAPPVLASL